MRQKSKHTTMRFTSHDMEAIARIKELYGCLSDTAAVRLALHIVSRQEQVPTPAPNKDAAFIPVAGSQGPSAAGG